MTRFSASRLAIAS